MLTALESLATRREADLFEEDLTARRQEIAEALRGRRVLVIGGAGSIGRATLNQLLVFRPRALHVVDQDENGIVERVRDVRSRFGGADLEEFRALPLDFGSPVMERFLRENRPYDLVLNFAALKHVRSEKDVWSVLQLLDTNVLKPARLQRWLRETGSAGRYFCVSSDKAADPANLMGASKRLMEHVALSGGGPPATTARFANVAFSNGSLLHGFLQRLAERQPLAVPRDTRRYFVTHREAGEVCLLAATCIPESHVAVPRMTPEDHLVELERVAEAVLRHHGFQPLPCHDEDEARRLMATEPENGRYPLLLTPLDTTGEKRVEVFVGAGETAVDIGLRALAGIRYVGGAPDACRAVVEELSEIVAHPERTTSKADLVRLVRTVVPELRHADTGHHLDERM